MTAFITALGAAARSAGCLITGEPTAPVRTPWLEVHAAGRRGAARLVAAGLRPGGTVAVLAAAPAEVAPLVQAAWWAGASVTMLHQPTARTDPGHFAAETAQVLGVIGAHHVLLGEQFAAFDGRLRAAGIGVHHAAVLTGDGDELAEPVAVEEESTLLLQLTSGSTATPKAVRISHANAWNNLNAMRVRAEIVPGASVMVSWLPLFHDMGMVGFLTLPMVFGVDVVTVTPTDFLRSPLLWFELVTRYGGTHTAAPNFAYALAARALHRAEGLDLSTLRFALNGAEPIDVTAVRAFLAAGERFGLPPTAMVPAYGMAETTLGVSIQHTGRPFTVDVLDAVALEEERVARPPTTEHAAVRSFPRLGQPLDDIEVQVRDDAGTVLADGGVGTLYIRGPAVTDRYLTVDGDVDTQGADGWLDTGDVGYLVDGDVVVCGRVKDVIIMGGRNIYPTDIERVATSVDGVRAGNAIAVRWTASGGRESFVVACESRQAEDTTEVARIVQQVRAAVTTALGVRPAQVLVLPVGSIPKTPSGKLKRSAAKEWLERRAAG
ncbi:MAG: fatty acyl-AMP ligase [Nakamurella sp.]